MFTNLIAKSIAWLNNYLQRKIIVSEEMLEKEKLQPAPYEIYETILFQFLYQSSNEFTGLNFKKRFSLKMEENRKLENTKLKSEGKNVIPPFLPDLDTLLYQNKIPLHWISWTIRYSFFRLYSTQSIYSCIGRYKLSPNELNNISDLENLKKEINIFSSQFYASYPKYPIQCIELSIDKGYLEFHLIHKDRFVEKTDLAKEIDLKDGDF